MCVINMEVNNDQRKENSIPERDKTETTSVLMTNESAINSTRGSYNPFLNRNLPHPTSTLGAFFHLLKSSLGSGLLAMPAAYKHAGLVAGTIGTFFVAFIATHCVHILVRTSQEICRETEVPLLSYADTCEAVFKNGPKKARPYSKFIRHFVDYSMACVCLGGTSVYVIFIASSLKDLVDQHLPDQKLSIELYCLILFIPLVLITQLRHLKFLVPFSIFANICLCTTFCITCYYCSFDIPKITERKLMENVVEWPLFVSTAIFAMEGINMVMPVENEMSHPEHFLGCPGILNATMIFVSIFYAIVGLLGYIKYGNEVKGSLTLNLPQDEPLAITAIMLIALAVFLTYALQMYPPMDIIWIRVRNKINLRYHNLSQIVIRILCVLLTVTLAIAVPDLESLIGLVGAIFFSTLGLLTPAVIETVHKWNRGLGVLNWILWKNALLILFYFIVLISGCYASVREIRAKFTYS